MIKAVIFDCFGVLTTDGWLAFRDQYLAQSDDLMRKALEFNHQVDTGTISFDDFVMAVANLAGVSYEQAVGVINGNQANQDLFRFIRDELAPEYAIGLLSNAGGNWLDRLFEPWQQALIEQATFSFELGGAKPDALMYQTIMAKLGAAPEECLYIDDQARFVAGAEAVGMTGYTFRDTADFKQFAREFLAL